MIRRFIYAVCMLVLSVNFMFAQERDNKKFRDAKYLMDVRAYEEALSLYEDLLLNNGDDLEVLYDLGYCELYLGEYEKSISHYEKLYSLLSDAEKAGDVGFDIQSLIGANYQLLEQPAKAITVYEAAIASLNEDQGAIRNEMLRQIEICENAIELMAKPVKLSVTNLGPEINSRYDDHSPLISANEDLILFTSRRASSYSELLPDGQYAERIYSSRKENDVWGKASSLNSLFRKEGHEAGVCLSIDGSELYIFRNDITGSNIYMSKYDGTAWSEPVKLPAPINSKFNETHASVSADNNTLYFTSNREGGVGGLDIYRVRKLPNGEWGTPENMRDLNTPYDEETPMIHPNGKTIYFSSEGHNSMGKFDIFYSQLDEEGNWGAPVNIGYPINTADDDFFFVPTTTQNLAYYASSKYDGSYGGSDLYLIEYEEPLINRLAVFKGMINAGDHPLENVRVIVTNSNTNEQEGVYKPHPGTGEYVLILEADKDYEICYQGEGFDQVIKNVDVEREMAYRKSDKALELDEVDLLYTVKEEKPDTLVQIAQVVADDGIPYYTVQFVSLRQPLDSYSIFEEHGLDTSLITLYDCKDGWYRYTYGSFKGFKAALKVKKEMFVGIRLWDDAFVREIRQYDSMVKVKTE